MVFRGFKIGSFLITILTLSGSCLQSSKTSEKRNITIELNEGDIAFRRGLGAVSNAVVMMNNRATYSHCGVVVKKKSEWCVIHAVPYEGEKLEDDKVYCEPIGEFYSTDKADCGAIYRMDALDSLQKTAITSFAKHHFESGTQFDHDYNLEDDTQLYCSELVWRAYVTINRDLSQGRRTHVVLPPFKGKHIMPTDIELNDSLTLIYSF